jgi:RNA polymerase sigma-70 factor (ECF subfamily)
LTNKHKINPHQHDLTQLFRSGSGRILAALISQCRDLQLAEDALQDAFVQASERWQRGYRPDNPQAWLLIVARRRMLDRLRRSTRQHDPSIVTDIANSLQPLQLECESAQPIPDERLKLIFTCCHPALNPQSQVALTLKTLCGLTAREIARAYLVSETTMNQRLVRAKQKIRRAGIPYKVPKETDLPERLDSVLATIYLIYNESYSAFEGQSLTRDDLADEAIRLARVLNTLLPTPEVAGLLALMLLHQARKPARSSDNQTFIPLQNQDRRLWNQGKIEEGQSVLLSALGKRQPGKYQLQASISALHSKAESWRETDWTQIYFLYLALYHCEPTPVVKLNAIVALSNSGKVSQALEQLETLQEPLTDYQPYYAAKADIEVKNGLIEEATVSFQKAISLSNNRAEQNYLSKRLEACVDRL